MTEQEKPDKLVSEAIDTRRAMEEFPAEPFTCPACGQLLAPSCRICVACKHAIDPNEIRKPSVPRAAAEPTQPEPEPVRFSWRIFLIVFALWVAGASLVQHYMDPLKGQLVLGSVQILCSFWVLYDALQKRLPKPQRWGIGTLLLWPIIFPWYLARRSEPTRPCPFIESRVSPRMLAVLFIVLIVFFYVVFKYAPPK